MVVGFVEIGGGGTWGGTLRMSALNRGGSETMSDLNVGSGVGHALISLYFVSRSSNLRCGER